LSAAPLFSVVIPTYRRWDRLLLTLRALEAQSFPKDRFEVIVSDDGSGDGTVEQVQAFSATSSLALTLVTGPNGGPATARNRGMAQAKGEWIAMTDDDCVPAPDWLSAHAQWLGANPGSDAFGGRVVRYTDSLISRYVDWTTVMLPPVDRKRGVLYLVTANAVFRRELVQRLGGFTEAYKWPGGEDPDLSYRARDLGARLGYNPDSVVRHMHRESVRGTYRMFWHHGLGLGEQRQQQGGGPTMGWWEVIQRFIIPGMRQAFRERPFREACGFAFLQAVRYVAFHRGVRAHAQMFRSGATSAN
jgi:glycosyltransferase involved in cell wall biosynthesis